MTKRSLTDLLAWIRVAGHYDGLRTHLRNSELPSGRGWEGIERALLSADSETVDLALDAYVDQTVRWGRKSIRFLQIPNLARLKMCAVARSRNQASHPDWNPLGTAAEPALHSTEADKKWCSFFLRSTRQLKQRIPLELEWIKPEHRDNLGPTPKLIAESEMRVVAFDVLHIPMRGPAILLVSDDFQGYQTQQSADELIASILNAISIALEVNSSTLHQIDLFALSDEIYRDSNDGTVEYLGFSCTSGARRKEVMSSRTQGACLRAELYHKAGIQEAVIHPYSSKVAWGESDGLGRNIYLELRGTSRMLASPQGSRLKRALTNAQTQDEFEFILKKIIDRI